MDASRRLILRLLLAFGVCECYIIEPGPKVRATNGEVWPKPQSQRKLDSYFVVNAQLFEFKVQTTAKKCNILENAFLRYQRLILEHDQVVENNVNSFNRVRGKKTWNEDPKFLGYLKQLNVTLDGQCDEGYPYLGMEEDYTLSITTKEAVLVAPSTWGVLRGLETFSQMIYLSPDQESLRINSTTIVDWPRFPHRGVLMDTSRHFMPMKVILEMIDAMAYNKMNVFHWHIVDDQSFPYVSKRFPELSEKGAYTRNQIYPVSDVQYVIDYARDRGIRVLPEFDTPGHTRSWGVSRPELLTECYKNTTKSGRLGPVDPTKNSTYTFMKQFFEEIVEVFPEQYLHLGGDEVQFECWSSNPSINAFMKQHFFTNYTQLESYYIQKLMDMVDEMGSKAIVWEEVFENGVNISSDTVVQVWTDDWENTLHEVTSDNKTALLSSCWYLDMVESYGTGDWLKYYRCEPFNFTGTAKQKALVLGGEACMWAEVVDQFNVISRVWPRASAVAERLWSAEDVTDETEAARRLEEHTCRMNMRGIAAQPPNGPGFCL